jgi:hypothetical protein
MKDKKLASGRQKAGGRGQKGKQRGQGRQRKKLQTNNFS